MYDKLRNKTYNTIFILARGGKAAPHW